MAAKIIPAIEHVYANALLKSEETQKGHIEVYSVVIDSNAMSRSNHADDNAKKVTIDGVVGFLVVDPYENYLRPDFISQDALVEEPVLVNKITPFADKSREEELKKSTRAKEISEAKANEQEKKQVRERKIQQDQLNKASLINEKVDLFNEITGSKIPHVLVENASNHHLRMIDKAILHADENEKISKIIFDKVTHFWSQGADAIGKIDSLIKNGYYYDINESDDLFNMSIVDKSGNVVLDFQAPIIEVEKSMTYQFEDEYDYSTDEIDITIRQIDMENPVKHTEFGRTVMDPEKSFFLNEVDHFCALEDIYLLDDPDFDIDNFDVTIFNTANLSNSEVVGLFENCENDKLIRKIQKFTQNRQKDDVISLGF